MMKDTIEGNSQKTSTKSIVERTASWKVNTTREFDLGTIISTRTQVTDENTLAPVIEIFSAKCWFRKTILE